MAVFTTLNSPRGVAEPQVSGRTTGALPAGSMARDPSGPAGATLYDEAALVAAARQGHLPAFNQLILHYQSLAYNIACRLLDDPDAAQDAVQDSFIKAYQRLGQYRGGSFKSWLLRIVTNSCYDVLRLRRRRPSVPLEADEDEDEAEYSSRWIDRGEQPEAHAVRQELSLALQAAIARLPLHHRTVLILSDVEGLDYQEIAEVTGVALGTVKSRLFRARAAMRYLLLQHGELVPAAYRPNES